MHCLQPFSGPWMTKCQSGNESARRCPSMSTSVRRQCRFWMTKSARDWRTMIKQTVSAREPHTTYHYIQLSLCRLRTHSRRSKFCSQRAKKRLRNPADALPGADAVHGANALGQLTLTWKGLELRFAPVINKHLTNIVRALTSWRQTRLRLTIL